MTVQPIARTPRIYKVNSLDRGLDVLRVIRNADGPVRNHDIVASTGLPKATVSRLVHTLTAMGYLRRIDQGSYVLGQASGRSGRAMLEGLKLERHAPLFADLVENLGAYVTFGMNVDDKVLPVFRWSSAGNILISSGVDIHSVNDLPLMTLCCDHARDGSVTTPDGVDPALYQQLVTKGWCAQRSTTASELTLCAGFQLSSVAMCVLAFHVPQLVRSSPAELTALGQRLLAAADAIARETPHQ